MYRLLPVQCVLDDFRSAILRSFKPTRHCYIYNKPKCSKREFSVSTFLKAKLFADHENDYAFDILKKIPLPTSECFQLKSSNKAISSLEEVNDRLNQEWRTKTASEIVKCFVDCLDYCVNNNITIADTRFDKLVDGLVDHVEHITDEELSQLLQCLAKYPPTDSLKSHNFQDVWSALDDLCCWKLPSWTLEKMFHFAELWYNLRLARPSDFVFEMIEKLIRKADKLTKEEVLATFFYLKVNKRRQMPFELRDALDRYCSQMTIDEMALCAMTFNISKTTSKSPVFCSELIEKLKREAKTADDSTVKSICNLLRLSSSPPLAEKLMDLLDVLTEEIDRLSNLSCLHIALLGINIQMLHEKSISKVTQKLVKDFGDVDKIRLKDIERLLLALTTFELHPKSEPDVFQAAYDEIHQERRMTEMVRHPKCLPSILHFLSFKGIYSYELMNRILDPEYIIETFGKYPKGIPRELFCLDPSIEIECPNYKGNRLSEEVRHKLTKWNTEYTPSADQRKKLTAADMLSIDVTETVSKIVKDKSHYFVDHVLPHFSKSDIIICKDIRSEEFVKIEGFQDYILGDVMYPPKREGCRWYAICVIGWNNTIRGTSKVVGLMNMKRRHLEKIGYVPVFVLWNEYKHLTNREKFEYISNKIC